MEGCPKIDKDTGSPLSSFIASKRSASPLRWLMDPTNKSLRMSFFAEHSKSTGSHGGLPKRGYLTGRFLPDFHGYRIQYKLARAGDSIRKP